MTEVNIERVIALRRARRAAPFVHVRLEQHGQALYNIRVLAAHVFCFGDIVREIIQLKFIMGYFSYFYILVYK